MSRYSTIEDIDVANLFDYSTIARNVDMYGTAHMCTLQELLHSTKIRFGSDDYQHLFDEMEELTGHCIRVNDYGDVVAYIPSDEYIY